MLNIARAVQGLGGAIVMPLTLTILSAAVPPAKRGLALGAWGAIGGLAIAFGPVVGGAVVEGFSWQYIFWLNVPIGIVLVPLALQPADREPRPGGQARPARRRPRQRRHVRDRLGPDPRQRRRAGRARRSSPRSASASLFVAAFVAWELRAPHPMLPMTFFRNAAFSLANLASLFMFFGMFGSIFLLTQFFQTVQGYSPLSSGLRILPWTLAPMFVAPFAGAMSDRISPKRILGIGLTLQAIALGWIAAVSTPTTPYASLIVPVRPRRRRDGAVLHADGEPRALDRPARAGRPGVRRQQRDPRARRRVRRRRARLGLLPLRRLRDRPDVRRRDDAGALDRRDRRRPRRRRRVRDPDGPPRARRRAGGAARPLADAA